MRALALIFGLGIATAAVASETSTYSYDARGRLIDVSRSGSVNNGIATCYSLDQADNRSNVTIATSPCTVTPPASFSISDGTATEGGSLVFTVTRTGSPGTSLNVNYATTNGTATAGSDYTAASGSLTFTSSDVSKTISVTSTADSAVEGTENLFVNLSDPTGGAVLADYHAAGTIADDDGAGLPSFAVNDASATEGGLLTFTVTKTGTTPDTVVVFFEAANGTAYAGSDYQYIDNSSQLTFGPAETAKTITIQTIDDALTQGGVVMYINLIGAWGGTISDGQGVGTINDDEYAVACNGNSFTTANSGAVAEGAQSQFTVTRSGTATIGCSVNYATANGTATQPSDYTAKSGTLTFSPGVTTQNVFVNTTEDAIVESTETFSMSLSAPTSGATLGTPSTAAATINDDDVSGPCSGITFAAGDASAVEGGSLTFSVTKSGTTSNSCSVNYATADDSADSAGDYFATSGTLTFTSAETTKTLVVATRQNNFFEETEYFFLNLSSPTTGADITDAQGVGTILDDDEDPCPNC